jgi:hypothetical protein
MKNANNQAKMANDTEEAQRKAANARVIKTLNDLNPSTTGTETDTDVHEDCGCGCGGKCQEGKGKQGDDEMSVFFSFTKRQLVMGLVAGVLLVIVFVKLIPKAA